MSTKITTPVLIDLPGETLPSENTAGVVLPKGTTAERPGAATLDFLVVAGGGGTRGDSPGGGGAGGLRTSWTGGSGGGSSSENQFNLSLGTYYTLIVGDGGAATSLSNGGDSTFDSITSLGGGRGGGSPNVAYYPGVAGGSGSGGAGGQYNMPAGAGTTGQGYAGGSTGPYGGGNFGGGGGGGAGGLGGSVANSGQPSGAGGVGLAVNILNSTNAVTATVGEVSGSDVYYAGGGGGSGSNNIGTGGLGGDGNGTLLSASGNVGGANTGGGAGGANVAGGSGVVILRYSSDLTLAKTGTLVEATGSPFTEGSDNVSVFTSGTGTVGFSGGGVVVSTGEFRYNTTDKLIEFYNGTTWKQIADEHISGQPSTCICNFPTTSTALFQFNDNLNDTCGGTAATSSGTSYGTGKFGKAILFNGTSSYATLPNSIGIPSGPWTVSYWFNTNSVTGEEPHMVTDWNTANYTLMIKTIGTSLNVYGYTCAGSAAFNSQPISATTTIATGIWYHVALVIDNVTLGDGVTLYINGSSEATTTLSNSLCTSATNWLPGPTKISAGAFPNKPLVIAAIACTPPKFIITSAPHKSAV